MTVSLLCVICNNFPLDLQGLPASGAASRRWREVLEEVKVVDVLEVVEEVKVRVDRLASELLNPQRNVPRSCWSLSTYSPRAPPPFVSCGPCLRKCRLTLRCRWSKVRPRSRAPHSAHVDAACSQQRRTPLHRQRCWVLEGSMEERGGR